MLKCKSEIYLEEGQKPFFTSSKDCCAAVGVVENGQFQAQARIFGDRVFFKRLSPGLIDIEDAIKQISKMCVKIEGKDFGHDVFICHYPNGDWAIGGFPYHGCLKFKNTPPIGKISSLSKEELSKAAGKLDQCVKDLKLSKMFPIEEIKLSNNESITNSSVTTKICNVCDNAWTLKRDPCPGCGMVTS